LRRFSVASKREAVHTQQNLILKMKAAVKLDKDAHSEGEMQEAMNKLEVLRDKLHKARRTAQGLPQKNARTAAQGAGNGGGQCGSAGHALRGRNLGRDAQTARTHEQME
jgi:hypothetical protein